MSPTRMVILGAGGFLGRALKRDLAREGIETLALARDDLDLERPGAGRLVAQTIRPDDSVVLLSALTPDRGRDIATLMRNLTMVQNFCAAGPECAQVIYLSSDAVYPLSQAKISEVTCAAPDDLYGSMHKVREVMLQNTLKSPLAILRSSMLYGPDDTHNSYGPNRFRRQAVEEGQITLGGEGEETRDHVLVDDAAAVVRLCATHRSVGTLNIATGSSASFMDVARLVARQFDEPIEIKTSSRRSPISYRSFDTTACLHAFPTFHFTPLEKGLADVHIASLEPAGA
ncbi:MAG: SDR family oxidoreductase [Hyphomicrobium sp.]|uniref:NAD-dependent epimerase/dehydratase family protein n=1 Tax=Hyphomicrobium sp. TaxID=82 RepID=UPI001328EC4A|nr:SDR family oxidoreductase [Hyphomicrobium sp.]KAB2939006.1 MAG: SDR family oxidoreductase [Hyphomicrobium sp.]MBZ0211766.1 SDR family oxidoreductase [Hyphomicrobium sp.]